MNALTAFFSIVDCLKKGVKPIDTAVQKTYNYHCCAWKTLTRIGLLLLKSADAYLP